MRNLTSKLKPPTLREGLVCNLWPSASQVCVKPGAPWVELGSCTLDDATALEELQGFIEQSGSLSASAFGLGTIVQLGAQTGGIEVKSLVDQRHIATRT